MLPFYISKLFGTLFESHGYAIVKKSGIKLAFGSGKEEIRLLDADVKEVLIDWENFGD